jgi:hypothetical protein
MVNNTEDDDNNNDDATGSGNNDDNVNVDEDEDYDDSSDKDNNDELAAETNVQEGNDSDGNQEVRRSQCRGKGTRKKYADYSLLMASMRAKRGGQCRALICDECVFFSSDKENREEFTLGVALVHYLMTTSIKKFKEKGETGVTKELTQMHVMNMFCPIEVESMTYDKKRKPTRCSCFSRRRGTVW